MRCSASKGIGFILIIFLIMNIHAGCATDRRAKTEPPPRLRKELDSLKPDAVTTGSSTRYTVKPGDTVWRIAYNHGVSPDSIIRTNNIKDVTNIKPGQQLIIPAGISVTKNTSLQKELPAARQSHESFIWPLRGNILLNFEQWVDGYKNNGIDIQAVNGQVVNASKGGIVALTSDTPDGWGKVVIIQHENNSYTWYAYNSSILVKKGDSVIQGQAIAKAGSTGRAKQDKLHFKIFIHGVPVNPVYYLQ